MTRDSAPQLQELGVRGITGPGGKLMAAKKPTGMKKKKVSAANQSVPTVPPTGPPFTRPPGGTFRDPLTRKKAAMKKNVGY